LKVDRHSWVSREFLFFNCVSQSRQGTGLDSIIPNVRPRSCSAGTSASSLRRNTASSRAGDLPALSAISPSRAAARSANKAAQTAARTPCLAGRPTLGSLPAPMVFRHVSMEPWHHGAMPKRVHRPRFRKPLETMQPSLLQAAIPYARYTFLRLVVTRRPATPRKAAASGAISPMHDRDFVLRRSRARTCEPMNPVPPMTARRIACQIT
jgi:hypothetical protein